MSGKPGDLDIKSAEVGVDATASPSRPSASRSALTFGSVAYDQALAGRIRALLPEDAAVSEQAMFGGLAFLVGGNMAIAASGQGGVLVRVDPAASEQLQATTTAVPMEMRGRQMPGWLRVSAEQVRTKRQLSRWVTLGVEYAGSLPSKG
ncbi:MAG: hypothetical protein QOG82_2789 [Actinomycetota bacterium]|jgi:TfoX/Sxy family transcriptional regulator of competence genes|nr:hypothetical protein [Actinomycetota bacterium]